MQHNAGFCSTVLTKCRSEMHPISETLFLLRQMKCPPLYFGITHVCSKMQKEIYVFHKELEPPTHPEGNELVKKNKHCKMREICVTYLV